MDIGSGNGLVPNRHQAVTWTDVHLMFIYPVNKLQWNIDKDVQRFPLKKIYLIMFFSKMAPILFRHRFVISLWPGDTICPMPPSHYLNQCWLLTRSVLWHLPNSNFTRTAHDFCNMFRDYISQERHMNLICNMFGDYMFKITATPSRDQWVNKCLALTTIFGVGSHYLTTSQLSLMPPFGMLCQTGCMSASK